MMGTESYIDREILVVGMGNSPHLTGYVNRLLGLGARVSFINCGATENYSLNPNAIDHSARFQQTWLGARFMWWVDRPVLRSSVLSNVIHKRIHAQGNFDLVIAHDLQRAGYPASKALRRLNSECAEVRFHGVSLGNDLYWYPSKKSHAKRLIRLLTQLGSIEIECSRERDVLQRFGFSGMVFGTRPNTPIDFSKLKSNDFATRVRNLILIKGYGGKWGLGWRAILACWVVRQSLVQHQVKVYSASVPSKLLVKLLRVAGVPISVNQNMTRESFLELLMSTHVHVGVSRSDGLATASAEAALLGAHVIQSRSSCVSEYLSESGSVRILPDDSLVSIVEALREVLTLPVIHEFAGSPVLSERITQMGAKKVTSDWKAEFSKLFQ